MTKRKPRPRKLLWMEEFERCHCTNAVRTKREMLGYCEKHGNKRQYIHRVQPEGVNVGHAG